MRVDLRRRDIGVSEHLLNRPDVGVILHKMGGKRMTERMRRNAFKAAFFRIFGDRKIDRLPRDGRTVRINKHPVDLDIFELSSNRKVTS